MPLASLPSFSPFPLQRLLNYNHNIKYVILTHFHRFIFACVQKSFYFSITNRLCVYVFVFVFVICESYFLGKLLEIFTVFGRFSYTKANQLENQPTLIDRSLNEKIKSRKKLHLALFIFDFVYLQSVYFGKGQENCWNILQVNKINKPLFLLFKQRKGNRKLL